MYTNDQLKELIFQVKMTYGDNIPEGSFMSIHGQSAIGSLGIIGTVDYSRIEELSMDGDQLQIATTSMEHGLANRIIAEFNAICFLLLDPNAERTRYHYLSKNGAIGTVECSDQLAALSSFANMPT